MMTTTGSRFQPIHAARAAFAGTVAIAGCLAFGQGPAAAQDMNNPSFEASLKRYCPTKNLEFLKPDVLAKTADRFVADLPKDQAARVKDLSKPGVDACAGSADESCRTAAVLGSVRFAGLSEKLAQRFCQLPIACQDWFVCSDVAQRPATASPPEAERQEQAAAAPQRQPPAVRPAPDMPPAVPPDEEMDDEAAAEPPQAPAPGPVARAPLPPATIPASPPALRPPSAPPVDPPRSAQDSAPAPDGRAAVAGFYNALGRGDGIEAAQFLIPEKRGRGPFSAAAMQRFYGSLRQPLRLTDIEELGPTRLRARYSFVTQAGAVCAGNSVIAVRPTVDGALIESIRALSGC